MKGERDAEIAKVMAAMSDELAKLQRSLEKTSEIKVTRLQERYQLEIGDLSAALETWKQACQEAKVCLRYMAASHSGNIKAVALD